MRGTRLTLLLAGLLAVAGARAAATEGAGLSSPLMLGSGARALGMGRAMTAVAADADALFWNPARLSAIQRGDLTLFRSQLYTEDSLYHAAFLSYPSLDFGSFALGFQTLGVGGIDQRDSRNLLLGEFESRESHLLLGYGRELQTRLSVGLSLRIAQQKLADFNSTGVGADVGASWWRFLGGSQRHRLSTGITVVHLLQPQLKLDEETVQDPRLLRLGLGYEGMASGGSLRWTVSSDLEIPEEGDQRAGAGLELVYEELLSLRGGLEGKSPSFGFGVEYRGVRVEYALRTHEELSRNDRFTIGVRFGADLVERRFARQQESERRVESLLAERLRDHEQEAIERGLLAADDATRRGEYEAARSAYRRVLAIAPDRQEAIEGAERVERMLALKGAKAELGSQNFARAAAAYQAILDRWPSDESAAAGLSKARVALAAASDRMAQIAELFSTALGQFSDGNLLGASNSLEELLHLEPTHALGAELLARVQGLRERRGLAAMEAARRQVEAEQFQAALASLRQARQLLASGQPELNALEDELRQSEQAALVREAEQARTLAGQVALPFQPERRPMSADARARLGALFEDGLMRFTDGDFEGATRRWHAVWTEQPEFNSVGGYLVKAYLLEGIQLYSQGEYESAIARCRRVLEIEPKNAKAQRYLARIEEERAEILNRSEIAK